MDIIILDFFLIESVISDWSHVPRAIKWFGYVAEC